MDMSFQVAQCDLCGKYPSLGWLYQCNQDKDQEASIKNGNQHLHITSADSFLVAELKSLGFSPSIIKQATPGQYSEDQLDLLKAQKENVHAVIEKQIGSSPESTGPKPIHPNITTRKHKIPSPRKNIASQTFNPSTTCALKCCHVRPFWHSPSSRMNHCI
jgi:hypothetical protein